MITTTREEILLVLRGSFSHFDEGLQKWRDAPDVSKFQILQTDTDFLLRISTNAVTLSDPLVFTSTRNVACVTPHSKDPSLQIQLRGAVPHNIRLSFNSHRDKDHFYLILKNAIQELKSRRGRGMKPKRPAPMLPPSKSSDQGLSREQDVTTNPGTMSPLGLRGAEPSTRKTEVEMHVEELQKTVASGDAAAASEAAKSLALKKVKLSVSVDEIGDMPGRRSKFNLEVSLEDRKVSGAKIKLLDLVPNMTISFLKKMVFQQYKFPVQVQHWIVGRRIVRDSETLMDCRINSSTPVFLYLSSAEKAGITAEEVELGQQGYLEQQRQQLLQQAEMPPQTRDVQATVVPLPSRGSRDNLPVPGAQSAPKKPTAEEVGWHCPTCTLINPPTIPGCRACMKDRPTDYVIPDLDSYIMDEEEKAKQAELSLNEQLMEKMERRQKLEEAQSRDNNFQSLLRAGNKDIVPNLEVFECLICYTEVAKGEGVMLKECLHTFCRECLNSHIIHSTDPVIMCPFNDGTYTCPEAILQREISALVSPEEFQQYLQRGLSVAESQDPNSFHCKTPDCRGFCFYDDDINFFRCPICGRENCLTCKAIHQGMNCKEYQDDLARKAVNDKAALMTQHSLEKMIQSGEAMNCPQCSIIMLKKEGCDWIKCSMCKLEVCWVTKGPRWGPAGCGDISGGCGCRVQGRRCHPQCQNCH